MAFQDVAKLDFNTWNSIGGDHDSLGSSLTISHSETDGRARADHARPGRTCHTCRSSSVRRDSVRRGRLRRQSGFDIRDIIGVWDSECSTVREPTRSQSPYHSRHRCCGGESLRRADGTRTKTESSGRSVRKRPLGLHDLVAKNSRSWTPLNKWYQGSYTRFLCAPPGNDSKLLDTRSETDEQVQKIKEPLSNGGEQC